MNKTNMKLICVVFSIGIMVSAILSIIVLFSNRKIISITYNLTSGDKMEIQMLSEDYRLIPTDTGFSITENGNEVLQGVLVADEDFINFKELVSNEDNVSDLGIFVHTNESDEVIYMMYDVVLEYDDEGNPLEFTTPTTTLVRRVTDTTSIVYYGEVELEVALACYDNLDYMIK